MIQNIYFYRDLSDIDRDGKINKEEFFIALHLTRFCANSKCSITRILNILYSLLSCHAIYILLAVTIDVGFY